MLILIEHPNSKFITRIPLSIPYKFNSICKKHLRERFNYEETLSIFKPILKEILSKEFNENMELTDWHVYNTIIRDLLIVLKLSSIEGATVIVNAPEYFERD